MYKLTSLIKLDPSVRADGLNTDRLYSDSGKIWIGCISGSGKIRIECISILWISYQPNGFRAPFLMLFFFVKIKNLTFLLLKMTCIQ